MCYKIFFVSLHKVINHLLKLSDMKKYVSYCRVSTAKQGLGLEAQAASIQNYVSVYGGTIVASFSEKESGKETLNRPELQAAISLCKAECYTLIVAKLDRLSRDIMDIFSLKKDKHLSFEVVDIDASDTMTLGIFATLAQKERELISKRTREALAAKKAEGIKLGNPKASETLKSFNHLGREKRTRQAYDNQSSRHAYGAIRFLQGSLRFKAEYLNTEGYRTSTGKKFTAIQVSRLINRYEQKGGQL